MGFSDDDAKSPTAMKGAVAGLCGASIIAAASLFGFSQRALLVLLVGMVLVALILVALLYLLKLKDKRDAAAGDEELVEQIRSRPQKLKNPEAIAKMTQLSTKLEEGIEKFRETNQSITDKELPWYLLVGETGSGKSEAVRHSGIDFAPGLNDEYQGSGGTVNMDWWFVNDGIILDTAGRLLVEQGETDSLAELRQFLQFVKKIRVDAPINGMILALPADSLIKDSVDDIQRKSGIIAKRLDLMRRALGTRFPVFVMITKSDLIPGFRSFFGDLNRPDLQHQIVGWSNPGTLNDDFDPNQVEQHLRAVRDRLLKRRLSLLVDPVHTEDEMSGRRLDQVDELYDFPDAFLGLGPSLKLYLQKIFIRNKFSPEPLFLRGIYFTSSMEQGASLDCIIARLRGKTIEELEKEGEGWTKERAVFLTHLFNDKVFKERGLVTRSGDPEGIPRRQTMLVLGAGFATILLVGFFTWIGQARLTGNIRSQSDFWTLVAKDRQEHADWWRIVSPPDPRSPAEFVKYHGTEKPQASALKPLPQFFADNVDLVKKDIEIPGVFRLPSLMGGDDINARRPEAFRACYESGVVRPVFESAMAMMPVGSESASASGSGGGVTTPWREAATGALIELIRIHATAAGVIKPEDDQARIQPLLEFIVAPGDVPQAQNDSAALQATYNGLYADPAARAKLAASLPRNARRLLPAIQAFLDYSNSQLSGTSGNLRYILAADRAVEKFSTDEQDLLITFEKLTAPVKTWNEYSARKKQWTDGVDRLAQDALEVDKAVADMGKEIPASIRGTALDGLYTAELQTARKNAREAADKLVACVDPKKREVDKDLADILKLVEDQGKVWASPARPEEAERIRQMTERVRVYLGSGSQPPGKSPLQVRLGMYQQIRAAMAPDPVPASVPPSSGAELAKKIIDWHWSSGKELTKETREAIQLVDGKIPEVSRSKIACENCLELVLAPAMLTWRIAPLLKDCPKDKSEYGALVQANSGAASIAIPKLPIISAGPAAYFDDTMNYLRLKPFLAGCQALISKVESAEGETLLDIDQLKEQVRDLAKAQSEYVADYIKYWIDNVRPGEMSVEPATWTNFHGQLSALRLKVADINEKLEKHAQIRTDALEVVKLIAVDPKTAAMVKAAHEASQKVMESLNSKAYGQHCTEVLTRWIDLSSSADRARLTLLDLKAQQLNDDYFKVNSEVPFWRDLSLQALKAIDAGNSQRAVTPFQEFMRDYGNKFPLAKKPKDRDPKAGEMIPVDQLEAAREKWELARRSVPPGEQAAATTIAQGAKTGDPTVDDVLARMRDKADAGARDALEKYGPIFDLLVPKGPAPTLTVSVLDIDAQKLRLANGRLLADLIWTGITWTDALKATTATASTFPAAAAPLGTLQFGKAAKNDVAVVLLPAIVGGPAVTVFTWKNPYQPLLLLQDGSAVRVSADGKVWHYEIVQNSGGKEYSLWLELKFDVPIPDLDKWPKMP